MPVGLRHEVTQLALDHLQQAFGRHGYVVEADWRPNRVAVVADGARRVDLHPIVFDAQRFRPSMAYSSIDSAKVNCPALRD
jgi:Aminoglycoside-2''-adenylyltransferase